MQISPTFPKLCDKKRIITYKRSKNLGELIRGHTLQDGKVSKTHPQITEGVNQSHATQRINHLYVVHKYLTLKLSKAIKPRRPFKFFTN